ncbi:MAG: type IV-A pilus assembly ATPase PilB [Deltaproteobacteria bacterium]|nr:type IV-A pilus assembly ATPase PilB [Deltaproteobacteria bacterium]
MTKRLGELLIKANLVTPDQVKRALDEQRVTGGSIGTNLIKLGYVDEDTLLTFLGKYYHVESVKLSQVHIDQKATKLVPSSIAKKHLLIPVKRIGPKLIVAMSDPSNIVVIDEIKFITGYNVQPVVATDRDLVQAIKKHYGGGGEIAGMGATNLDARDYTLEDTQSEPFESSFDDSLETVDVSDFDKLVHGAVDSIEVVETGEEDVSIEDIDAPIIKLVNGILIRAIKVGASDIHFEPYEKVFRVRYRTDGVLRKVMGLPLQIRNAITSRLKIMARLDIAEKRLPQDGRIKLRLAKGREMDFRVSVIPTIFGEKVVLRILDKSSLQLDMTKLGFDPESLRLFQEAFHKPVGMVLVTGPTGSGKTTTLYSALVELNKETDNIMTAEDPIEYNFMGINQVQMHEEIGLTFASALRSFLRQDPDIIMVGEIRDFETAQIAIQASLTGHMVLSTVHTNDAPSTISRLIDMGIEPFLITSSVNLILAQRLIRKICRECKEEVEISPKVLAGLGVPPEEIEGFRVFRGKGCQMCNGTGYKGRIGIYEVMPVTDELKELVLSRASNFDLKKKAISLGMKSLRQAGIIKIKEGLTTIEEVLRTTMDDR